MPLSKGILISTLFSPITVNFDRASGSATIAVADFIPVDMVVAPAGTIHFQLFSAATSVDFEKEVFDVDSVVSGELPYSNKPSGVVNLNCTLPTQSTHPVFIIVGIEFLQQVNGKFYRLKNGSFNACSIVKVDSPV